MSTERLSLGALLISRAYMYELLHKAFGGVPTDELLKLLSDKRTVDAVDEYSHADEAMSTFVAFLESISEKMKNGEYLDSLKDEYTRLFIGPNSLPVLPWKSPYVSREKVFFHEETLLVREAYRSHGLKARQHLHMPDDHISLMMGFMSQLSQKSIASFNSCDYRTLRGLLDEQKKFADDHLNSWLKIFADDLRKFDRIGFYAAFGDAGAAFCMIDSYFLNGAVEWLGENSGACDVGESEEVFADFLTGLDAIKSLKLLGLEDNELQEV